MKEKGFSDTQKLRFGLDTVRVKKDTHNEWLMEKLTLKMSVSKVNDVLFCNLYERTLVGIFD